MTQSNLSAEQSYAYALRDYLNYLIDNGQMGVFEANYIMDRANDLIEKGASAIQLPMYQPVSQWANQQIQEQYKEVTYPGVTENPVEWAKGVGREMWNWGQPKAGLYNLNRQTYEPLAKSTFPLAQGYQEQGITNPEALDPIRASMTPAELYIAQLQDYLNQRMEADREPINQLNQQAQSFYKQAKAGTITDEDYQAKLNEINSQLANLISQESAQTYLNEGYKKALSGYVGTDLPLFDEASQTVGPLTWEAYQAKTQPKTNPEEEYYKTWTNPRGAYGGNAFESAKAADIQRYKQEEKQRELEMRAQRIGPVKSYEQMYRPYLDTQNFSPNQRAYAERSFNNIAFDFENQGGAGRRQDWYNQQLNPSEEFTYGGGTLPEDPWQSYLKQHPFLENWNKLSMEQRGETRNRLTPRARWMG